MGAICSHRRNRIVADGLAWSPAAPVAKKPVLVGYLTHFCDAARNLGMICPCRCAARTRPPILTRSPNWCCSRTLTTSGCGNVALDWHLSTCKEIRASGDLVAGPDDVAFATLLPEPCRHQPPADDDAVKPKPSSKGFWASAAQQRRAAQTPSCVGEHHRAGQQRRSARAVLARCIVSANASTKHSM